MSKICLLADTHWGCRANSAVFRANFRDFYSKQLIPFLKKEKIKRIIHLGDLLDHRKFVDYLTLRDMYQTFFDPIRDLGINIDIILGNHDIYYKSSIDINSLEILLRQYSNGTIRKEIEHGQYDNVTIRKEIERVDIDGVRCLFVPWIGDNKQDSAYKEAEKVIDCDYLFGHLELKGFEMYKGIINLDRGADAKRFRSFKKVFAGHFHHRSSSGNIIYIGATSEVIWTDCGDPRGFAVFDIRSGDLEFVDNKFPMFVKVCYDDRKDITKPVPEQIKSKYVRIVVNHKENHAKYLDFLSEIEKAGPEHLSVRDNTDFEDTIEEFDVSEVQDTITIMKKYVDELDTDVNKAKLFKLMTGLYNTAMGSL